MKPLTTWRTNMAIRTFQIDVTVEGGQLYEELHSEEDRRLMIERMDRILSNTATTDPDEIAVRKGLIQILNDQYLNNHAHPPLIITTGNRPGDDDERLDWRCDHAEIEVEVEKYRHTDRTPRKLNPASNPFKFSDGDKGKDVKSTEHKNKIQSADQKFYKFKVKGKDFLGNDLTLDPCIICEK
jgi:hypothetical protein